MIFKGNEEMGKWDIGRGKLDMGNEEMGKWDMGHGTWEIRHGK